MGDLIKDYKCSNPDCAAVFVKPGPCPKCGIGFRRPVVVQLEPHWDTLVMPQPGEITIFIPPDDFGGPPDLMGPHGPGCTCGL